MLGTPHCLDGGAHAREARTAPSSIAAYHDACRLPCALPVRAALEQGRGAGAPTGSRTPHSRFVAGEPGPRVEAIGRPCGI